jgi:hypothetical protein
MLILEWDFIITQSIILTMDNIIFTHFRDMNLDIRKKQQGYSRFIDQKVTPDVLSFVSDCVRNLNKDNFSVRDIWESPYFEKNTVAIFGKPSPSNDSAGSEYNKFIGQPLKTLFFAGVLDETKVGNKNLYAIKNLELLTYISINDRNAFGFLYHYLEKVLVDSGFYTHVLAYASSVSDKTKNKREAYAELKEKFTRFILGHTEISGTLEIHRIFPKVLNVFAVRLAFPGSEKGKVTEYPFVFSDLMYNRTNFRDLKKNKGISRSEVEVDSKQQEKYTQYLISKAKGIIRDLYVDSEVRDQWSRGAASYIHHILPQADYPRYATYLENLIKLTPEQHFGKAHPNAQTNTIDQSYQLTCFLSKLSSIEKSLSKGESIYRTSLFIEILNERYAFKMNANTPIDQIREKLLSLLTV